MEPFINYSQRLHHYSKLYFNLFSSIGTDVHGFITNVYGPQSSYQKINLLNFLDWYRQEHPKQNWIIGGDFNLITNLREKKGGRRFLSPEDIKFKNFIEGNELGTWKPPMESTPGITDEEAPLT
jgi:hypothetical protein